jgi:antitoxin (DNA-binding transcriptional repressor) of toxin-antitoxin stability system
MKMISLEQTTLNICITDAQDENIVITHNGKAVALIIGIEKMDEEQLELSHSDKFWTLITERRQQKHISRAELEHALNGTP